MRILGLDLGTKTGWAYASTPTVIESGVEVFDRSHDESPGMRFHRFSSWLARFLDEVGPDVVISERAHLRGFAATQLALGFATRVQEQAALRKIEVAAPVHSAALKKWLTGGAKVIGRRATKDDVIDTVCSRWKIVDSEDEADAIAVLMWAMHHLGGGAP